MAIVAPSPRHPSPDHHPEAAAPALRTAPRERLRFTVLTGGSLVAVTGIVVAVAALLPFLAGWVLPVLLSVVTAVLLVLGRRAAWHGSTVAARAWAGWSGVTASLAIAGLGSLAGLGGALVAVLLVVIAVNAGIALWFRSPVHAAVVQVIGLVWGALAHVYGIVPLAALVLGMAGLWWCGRVGVHRVVVVATTILVPVGVALVLHPVTHAGAAVDGADVAVLTGGVAVALTCASVIGRARPVSTLWCTMRGTAVVVLVAQVVAGAVPAVSAALSPSDPWQSVLAAAAAVLASAAVAVVRPTRRGIVTVLVLSGVQLAELGTAVLAGPLWAASVGLGGLLVLVLVCLWREPARAPVRAALWAAVLTLPALWLVVVGAGAVLAASVLVVVGTGVAVLQTRTSQTRTPLTRTPR